MDTWDIWQNMFLSVADYDAPLKKRGVRGISCPWITPGLKTLLFQRDKLKIFTWRIPTDVNWTSYKRIKNEINREIKTNYCQTGELQSKFHCKNRCRTHRFVIHAISVYRGIH